MNAPQRLFALSVFVGLFAACGGGGGGSSTPPPSGGSPQPATRLVYTDPTTSDYRFVRNSSSTDTHLILDLLGPTGTRARGMSFYLNADATKVSWVNVNPSDPESIRNIVFTLGTGAQLFKSKINGGQLQGGAFQKGSTVSSVTFTSTGGILQVALDLKNNVSPGPIAFSFPSGKANMLPETGAPQAITTIAIGTLAAH